VQIVSRRILTKITLGVFQESIKKVGERICKAVVIKETQHPKKRRKI